jgi:hypothetical protein
LIEIKGQIKQAVRVCLAGGDQFFFAVCMHAFRALSHRVRVASATGPQTVLRPASADALADFVGHTDRAAMTGTSVTTCSMRQSKVLFWVSVIAPRKDYFGLLETLSKASRSHLTGRQVSFYRTPAQTPRWLRWGRAHCLSTVVRRW